MIVFERPAEILAEFVIEAVGSTQETADAICGTTRSTLLHYGYPDRISTAGNLAFPFSPSDFSAGEIFEFSVYHLVTVDDQSMFRLETETL